MSLPVSTIPEALLATAARGEGEYTFHLDEGAVTLSCEELAERAARGARRLAARGIGPGDPVGILGPNRPEWVVWAFATWLAGGVLVPVQLPLRVRDAEMFREQLGRLVEAGSCRRVIADPRLVGLVPPELAIPWDVEDGIDGGEPALPAPQDAAVIQFTSGSTTVPKGAILSHAAVMAQIDLLRHGYRYKDGAPRAVLAWTPFFHDLGLFANLVQPAVTGARTHHLPTERFARDPAEWLRLVGRTQVAATVAPSAAFGSALRTVLRRRERVDLSSLDTAYFAAEGVDPEVARQMVETAGRFGFRPEALGGTYGLAEAVMAVAYSLPGSGLRIDRVSLAELTGPGVATLAGDGPARLVASCGPPHTEVRIVGSAGELPDRGIGEIRVRGESLMGGYVNADASGVLVDGWLRTGDLGYIAAGELYVTGRQKDVMIVMGHNYYPEDFEWAAARVEGVRPGRCVAFCDPGEEGVVVLVEARDGASSAGLERMVARVIASGVGVAPSRVVVLPAGVVEKTTSGKLRRSAMREAYTEGRLAAAAAGR